MKTSAITILVLFFLSSCTYEPYPKEKYVIGESLRNLIKPYSVGDTLIFKSTQNIIDSFVISGIDSAINDTKSYLYNSGNSKSISITYRQIPVDKWQSRWLEGNDGKLLEHSEDGMFISVAKFPDPEETEYYYDFKEFRCSKTDTPKLHRDTIKIADLKISGYYKIENCAVNSENTNAIKVCFSTIDKGLVAFITKDSIIWTRQH